MTEIADEMMRNMGTAFDERDRLAWLLATAADVAAQLRRDLQAGGAA